MKKLMVAVAAVALAAVANANVVQWGLAAGNALDSTKFSAGTAYLINTADIAKPSAFKTAEAAETWFADNKDSLASKAFRTGDIVDGAFLSDPETIKNMSGRETYWLAFVSDDEKNLAISTVTKAIVWGDNETSSSATITSSQATPYAVPEPTSGLLLLLGVAGLALKRRRA